MGKETYTISKVSLWGRFRGALECSHGKPIKELPDE